MHTSIRECAAVSSGLQAAVLRVYSLLLTCSLMFGCAVQGACDFPKDVCPVETSPSGQSSQWTLPPASTYKFLN